MPSEHQDSSGRDELSRRDLSSLQSNRGVASRNPQREACISSLGLPTSWGFAAPAGFKTPQLQPDSVNTSNRQTQFGVCKREDIQADVAFKLMGFVALTG